MSQPLSTPSTRGSARNLLVMMPHNLQLNEGAASASQVLSNILPELNLIPYSEQRTPRFGADLKTLKPLNPIEEYDGLSTITSNLALRPAEAHKAEREEGDRERAVTPLLPFGAIGVAGAARRNTYNQEPPEYRMRVPPANESAIDVTVPSADNSPQNINDSL